MLISLRKTYFSKIEFSSFVNTAKSLSPLGMLDLRGIRIDAEALCFKQLTRLVKVLNITSLQGFYCNSDEIQQLPQKNLELKVLKTLNLSGMIALKEMPKKSIQHLKS